MKIRYHVTLTSLPTDGNGYGATRLRRFRLSAGVVEMSNIALSCQKNNVFRPESGQKTDFWSKKTKYINRVRRIFNTPVVPD